jgi:hypothetical protein
VFVSCAILISPSHKAQRTALDHPQAKNSRQHWIMGDCGSLHTMEGMADENNYLSRESKMSSTRLASIECRVFLAWTRPSLFIE